MLSIIHLTQTWFENVREMARQSIAEQGIHQIACSCESRPNLWKCKR